MPPHFPAPGSTFFPGTALPKLFTQHGLFPHGNIQVTSGTPNQARSESIIAVNPRDRNNLIAASKKFSNPKTYRFTIGVRVSFDGGSDWQDATLPTLPEWGDMTGTGGQDGSTGMSDPAAAFDDFGNAFMVGEPFKYKGDTGGTGNTIDLFIYKSTDGGLHWSAPIPLHVGNLGDDADKSWIACDNNPASPHYGNVYVAWGAEAPLRFARSIDHGANWTGIGREKPGSELAPDIGESEISVGLDGTVHIVWHKQRGTTIEYRRSTDGGETFEKQKSIVTGVQSLKGHLPEIGDPQISTWPHFPGATFRVLTLATGCGFGFDPLGNSPFPFFSGPKNFIVAWSDFREGAARIYYRTSANAGASFDGPENGQPLIGNPWADPNLHHFHPQIVCTGSGVIGCAYYEYTYKGEDGPNLIDVKLKASFDKGKTFVKTITVTENPWDPKIDAPFSLGDKLVTFIGEYFGLDAHDKGFDVLWTDTRTGVQELFYDRVETERYDPPDVLKEIFAQILFGVIQGGDGLVVVNGHIVHIGPRGPEYDLAQAMAALDAAGKISGPAGRTLTKNVYDAIGTIAKDAAKSLNVKLVG